jgi:hypothetical protein
MAFERDLYAEIKPVIDAPEAIIITGMRRVGKTTLLKYIQETIKSSNTLFIDLENPINRRIFEEDDYETILSSLKFMGLEAGLKSYVFLDEIQFVKTLPSVVKYLYDHYHIKFFLSGSSSFYIKNLFSESLSGRKYLFELKPLGFREFLRFRQASADLDAVKGEIPEAVFSILDRYYSEYLLYGGFPGVVLKESDSEKRMMLDDIFSSYFQLEVVQLGDFRKANVIRDLILLLIERTGSRLDIQKLSKELGVARETIYHYVAFLENTYFIKLIRPFSRNLDSEIRSATKFYLCDTGIINRFGRVGEGAVFENAVCCALQRHGELNYYQRKSGLEIDFIVNKQQAYEVKLRADERDLRKLTALSAELNLTGATVVSRKRSNVAGVKYGFMLG